METCRCPKISLWRQPLSVRTTGREGLSRICQGGDGKSCGAFHFSELTGQTIPVVRRISLLIKTIQQDQSNLKYYAQRRWFFSKNSLENPISSLKCLLQPGSGLSVLTNEKPPKNAAWVFLGETLTGSPRGSPSEDFEFRLFDVRQKNFKDLPLMLGHAFGHTPGPI